MFDEKSILFISEYNKENFLLAEKICGHKNSFASFWNSKELKDSRLDFTSLFLNNNFFDKTYIIPSDPSREDFISGLMNIVLTHNVDFIIVRGITTELWPFFLLKDKYEILSYFLLILDYLSHPLKDFEKESISCFDGIIKMGPSCENTLTEKGISLFKNRDSFLFRDISNIFEFPDQRFPVVLFDEFTDKSILDRFNGEDINMISVWDIEDRDLCIYINLSDPIINLSSDKEIELLIKKIGKKSIPEEEFLSEKHNFKRKRGRDDPYFKENNVKEYLEFLEKEIIEVVRNIKEKTIIGESIII